MRIRALASYCVCERCNSRSFEEVDKVHLHGHVLLERGEHAHRGERVAAELEEVRVRSDVLHAEHLAPDARDRTDEIVG